MILLALVLCAALAGCGDPNVKAAKAGCHLYEMAMASMDQSTVGASKATCGEIDAQNADQTLYDMQERCVRLASSHQRAGDKNIPTKEAVDAQNASIKKCNDATKLINSGRS